MQRKPKSVLGEVEYVPVKPGDVKYSVEVPVRDIPKESLTKIEKLGSLAKAMQKKNIAKKKFTAKKKTKKLSVEKEPKTRKSDLVKADLNAFPNSSSPRKYKSGGLRDIGERETYTLIITEKPQAAAKIASALADGKEKKLSEGGVTYFEITKDGKEILIASAAGHLFTLAQDKEKRVKGWPNFDVKWQPNFQVKKKDWSKKYYLALSKLCRNASNFIVATDYDIEGEVIGWNIVRFIAKVKDAKRMKYSTLTKDELKNSYENLMPTLDWGQAIAGETRHHLDWFYGINLSRGLMEAIKTTGSFRIFSIGRVQGPSLKLIVDKEKEILAFKPETYWQVFITVEGIKLQYNKDIFDKKELDKFKDLKGKEIFTETKSSERKLPPPAPFDLTTLQTESYKFFGISPAKTLQIAQQLYLAGFISYPRTSSQKIPEAIAPKDIIKKLSQTYEETKLCKRDKPVEGSKSDPAHPSIYPTGEFADVTGDEAKVYDLIVRRFLSCFCEDAVIADKVITGTYEDLKFVIKGLQIKVKNWLSVYKSKMKETELPDLNGNLVIEDVETVEKQTQPPRRYTPASLITELAKRNLGTKATRAGIIDILFNRGYVKGQSIEATPLGIRLITSLEKYSPIIVDEALTRKYEEEMEGIQELKIGMKEQEEKIIEEAKGTINKIAEEFKKHQDKIGKELLEASTETRAIEAEERKLQQCPVCKNNNLRILFNRASKRYFVACAGYPECKTTFSLPQGLIKRSDNICLDCNWPKLIAIRAGKRPWEFCFNPTCPAKMAKDQANNFGEGKEETEEKKEETETEEDNSED